jgi:hypothetical protein
MPGSTPSEMIHAALTDLTQALRNLHNNTSQSTTSLPLDTVLASAAKPLVDLISMYTSVPTSTCVTPSSSIPTPDSPNVPVVETPLSSELIASTSVQQVVTPPAQELIVSPVVQRVETPQLPGLGQTVQRVETPLKPSEPAGGEVTTPVVVSNLVNSNYVIPRNRDSRLRQAPQRKAYNAEQLIVEDEVIEEAIEQAEVEREFQAVLKQDLHFRSGQSNMAMAHAVMNLTPDGKPITRSSVMSSPEKSKWIQSDTDEYSRLHDSETWHAIYTQDPPKGAKATYFNPQYKEKIDHNGEHEHRAHFTAGGDRLDYDGEVSARTADIEVVKVLLNSALSTDSELMTLDIKDFYLGTP